MIGLSFSDARERIITEIHEYIDNLSTLRKIDSSSNYNSRNLLILISTTITGIVLLIVVIPYSRYYHYLLISLLL